MKCLIEKKTAQAKRCPCQVGDLRHVSSDYSIREPHSEGTADVERGAWKTLPLFRGFPKPSAVPEPARAERIAGSVFEEGADVDVPAPA